ncbi:adenosine deaminase [Kyrpidia tusciae]|uniref:Adenosine deaminase n=1 Tax=Kyrpidia tusciae (strain DSM 2912 / NBRC 15312 / T2) TaxID=562970 RepID=D5WQU0_KYRT2|nr:adenosine deaminase [Kyrpidia tusciae]ADG06699.1 adenosine deaminase [Kyrpidia tusciae DSM 2912]
MFVDMKVIRDLPKVELHVHLEGAIPKETVLSLAAEQNAALPRQERDLFSFQELGGFLRFLDWMCGLVREQATLETIAYDFAFRSSRQGIVYSEVIVNPTHWRALDLEQLVEAVHAGFDRAQEDGLADCRILLSLARHQTEKEARDLVEWLRVYRPNRVVGISVDGDEGAAGRTGPKFAGAYTMAESLGYGLTAHAGESSGPEGVYDALDVLGVHRIDHGVRAVEDQKLVRRLAQDHVPLNICVSSNLALLYPDLSNHPVGALYEAGIPVTINTDDPELLGVTLNDEFQMVSEALGWKVEDLTRVTEYAISAAFCEESKKRELRKSLRESLS